MDTAKKLSALVCGTENRSEYLLGYFTRFGDEASDLEPIAHLYKTQVYQLAEYLGIPRDIIYKSPTAGLWRGQTDEKELGMSYETLDKILYGLEFKMDYSDISKIVGVKKPEVERIRKMRIKSQHKRRTPLIPKIGGRTPGLDWRAPVQEG